MNINMQDWTHDVSGYLFTRRAQTAHAYASQLIDTQASLVSNVATVNDNINDNANAKNDKANANTNDNNDKASVNASVVYDNDNFNEKNDGRAQSVNSSIFTSLNQLFDAYAQPLFSAIFCLLAESLEQGHTVFVLVDKTNQAKQTNLMNQNNLSTWQMDLLESLLMADMALTFVNNLVTVATPSTQSPRQNTKDAEANQRNQLIQRLGCFFTHFNKLNVDEDNALQVFADYICQLPLFSLADYQTANEKRREIKRIQTPIVVRFLQSFSAGAKQFELTFWIHRNWFAEQSIVNHIARLNSATPAALDLSHINKGLLNSEQVFAVETANKSAFCIITGGPGTGKTYTVAQLVIALHHANEQAQRAGESPLSMVLSAPTGKAAQRMQESLQDALDRADIAMSLQEAKTIHRLLGIGQSGTPRYNQDMPLSEDVIIVDEASMLGVELANSLLSAVKTGARLILLGDSHQLSAVEAGAVLSDLCQMKQLQSVHANLVESRRFTQDSAVGQLASFINRNDDLSAQESAARLHELFSTYADIRFYNLIKNTSITSDKLEFDNLDSDKLDSDKLDKATNSIAASLNASLNSYPSLYPQLVYRQLIQDYQAYFDLTKQLLTTATLSEHANTDSTNIKSLSNLMAVFNQFQVLTAGHHSKFGDDTINKALTQHHRRLLTLPPSNNEWYHGRPVMVRRNNYALGLFNGDIGICVQLSDELGVYFEGREQTVAVNQLANLEVSTAYAMTVHKSQGSEFEHVAIMLDVGHVSGRSGLLSREMLYTGVTRAKTQVSIYATMSDMLNAIASPTIRRTGLASSYP